MHVAVGGGVEGVDVGFVDAGAGEADEGAGAEGNDGIGGCGETKVAFHRSVKGEGVLVGVQFLMILWRVMKVGDPEGTKVQAKYCLFTQHPYSLLFYTWITLQV